MHATCWLSLCHTPITMPPVVVLKKLSKQSPSAQLTAHCPPAVATTLTQSTCGCRMASKPPVLGHWGCSCTTFCADRPSGSNTCKILTTPEYMASSMSPAKRSWYAAGRAVSLGHMASTTLHAAATTNDFSQCSLPCTAPNSLNSTLDRKCCGTAQLPQLTPSPCPKSPTTIAHASTAAVAGSRNCT